MGRTRPLDGVFEALASDTRRALLEKLLAGEASVSELTEGLDVSQPAVSQQLAVLKAAGLVAERSEGRFRFYRLRAGPLRAVLEWTERYRAFWERRLDALGEVLDGIEHPRSKR
ncbi:MAG: ArsR/SmtB family transcription factor [Myxococcales bacterium]